MPPRFLRAGCANEQAIYYIAVWQQAHGGITAQTPRLFRHRAYNSRRRFLEDLEDDELTGVDSESETSVCVIQHPGAVCCTKCASRHYLFSNPSHVTATSTTNCRIWLVMVRSLPHGGEPAVQRVPFLGCLRS